MICDECKNNLGSWAKAELSAAQANRLEQHLAECESCSVAAHNELAIVTAMRESQEIPPPSPGFEKQVLDVAIGRAHRPAEALRTTVGVAHGQAVPLQRLWSWVLHLVLAGVQARNRRMNWRRLKRIQ